MSTCRFTAELWRWKAQESWFFVTVPPDESAPIRERPRPPRGFGSVRVRATIGGDDVDLGPSPTACGAHVLPVKKTVRRAEDSRRAIAPPSSSRSSSSRQSRTASSPSSDQSVPGTVVLTMRGVAER